MNIHPFNIKRSADFWRKTRSQWLRQNEAVSESDENLTADEIDLSVVSLNETMANLEAVLFLSREPLSARRLVQLADLPEGTRIRSLIRELNEKYDHRQSAFRVVEVAGGFQLRSRPEFAPWLVRMQEVPLIIRLSNPAMETLAVIAYRQPVLRAEIERMRGVQCGELIRQLLDRDLVKIVGRSEDLGRPFFYGTTKNFLQVFGLGSLNDLPDRELFEIPEEQNAQELNTQELDTQESEMSV